MPSLEELQQSNPEDYQFALEQIQREARGKSGSILNTKQQREIRRRIIAERPDIKRAVEAGVEKAAVEQSKRTGIATPAEERRNKLIKEKGVASAGPGRVLLEDGSVLNTRTGQVNKAPSDNPQELARLMSIRSTEDSRLMSSNPALVQESVQRQREANLPLRAKVDLQKAAVVKKGVRFVGENLEDLGLTAEEGIGFVKQKINKRFGTVRLEYNLDEIGFESPVKIKVSKGDLNKDIPEGSTADKELIKEVTGEKPFTTVGNVLLLPLDLGTSALKYGGRGLKALGTNTLEEDLAFFKSSKDIGKEAAAFVKENPLTTGLIIATVGYTAGKTGKRYLEKEITVELPEVEGLTKTSSRVRRLELLDNTVDLADFEVDTYVPPRRFFTVKKVDLFEARAVSRSFGGGKGEALLDTISTSSKSGKVKLPKEFKDINEADVRALFRDVEIKVTAPKYIKTVSNNLVIRRGTIIGQLRGNKVRPIARAYTKVASPSRVTQFESIIRGTVSKPILLKDLKLSTLDPLSKRATKRLIQELGLGYSKEAEFATGAIITRTSRGNRRNIFRGNTRSIDRLIFISERKASVDFEREFGLVNLEKRGEKVGAIDISRPRQKLGKRNFKILEGETQIKTYRLPSFNEQSFSEVRSPKSRLKSQRRTTTTSTSQLVQGIETSLAKVNKSFAKIPKAVTTKTSKTSTTARVRASSFALLDNQTTRSSNRSKYRESVYAAQPSFSATRNLDKLLAKEVNRFNQIPREALITREIQKQRTRQISRETARFVQPNIVKSPPGRGRINPPFPRIRFPKDLYPKISRGNKSKVKRNKKYKYKEKPYLSYAPDFSSIVLGIKIKADNKELKRLAKIGSPGIEFRGIPV